MSFVSSIKRKIGFAQTVVREPAIIYHRYKAKKLKSHHVNLTGKLSALVKEIRENGLSQPTLSDHSINLVKNMAARFDRLLAKRTFHQLPDHTRTNTVAFRSYLYYFNRGWPDYFPEIATIVEEDLGETLRGYFKQNYEIMGVQIARKKHIDANCPIKDPYSNFWHFD